MQPIYVTMLGRFDILVEGESTYPFFAKSPKGIMLMKYLLLNRGKPLSVSHLIDTLWAEPDKSNPESALKTMVSRLRSSLANASPLLKNCILSEKKSYQWNPEIPCQVDVFLFEELYHQLESETVFNEEVREKYIQVLNIYGGDLSYSSDDEDWIVSRSLYLHHLYLKVVYHFIELLKGEGDYETIIHVCRIALDIDTFDELLNLELMNALKEVGQNSAALMQYRHITSAYYKYLGIDPSEKILGFYKSLIKADIAAEADLRSIRQELQGSTEQDGAFICDYSIFKDIYQLQLRNLERQQSKMFLALLGVTGVGDEPIDPMVLDGIMRELLEILKCCLRKGDTVSRYSPSQYAILLPMLQYANGNLIIGRIKKLFYQRFTDTKYQMGFQFEGMNDIQ